MSKSPDYTWGVLLDRWHDEGPVLHLLREDGSPACGAKYFTSSSYPKEYLSGKHKCRNCERAHAKKAAPDAL